MLSSKALWHQSAETSQLLSTPLDPSSTAGVLLQSKFSLISIGTERLVAKGLIDREMYEPMQVPHMEGSFDFPIKYGYSLVAEVVTENHPWKGKLVHLLHPHQDQCIVNESALFLVPEGVPGARASLASNMETAVNAIWDGQVGIGDKVLVVGFGMIGALLSQVLVLMPGVEIQIIEKDAHRIALGQKMGFQISDELNEEDFDIAFNTSVSGQGLQLAIGAIGKEAKVIELSWYGKQTIELQLGKSFHHQRKKIISSQVGSLPLHQQARWDFARRKQLVFKLLQNEVFDQLITDFIPFEESVNFFDQIRNGRLDGLGYCISY